MELETFLWGVWNGISAWPLLILHVFAIWDKYPVLDEEKTEDDDG